MGSSAVRAGGGNNRGSGGAGFWYLPRPIIILSTSIVGAGVAIAGVLLLLSQLKLSDLSAGVIGPMARVSGIWTIGWVVLIIAGIIFQWTTTQPRTVTAVPPVRP